MITADTITDEQIRELRRDVMREWGERVGKREIWPEGKEALRLTIWAMDAGHAECHHARARCAEILNARAKVSP